MIQVYGPLWLGIQPLATWADNLKIMGPILASFEPLPHVLRNLYTLAKKIETYKDRLIE